jgi:hypothetical protein
MAEGHRMTAAELVDKLLANEHADVLRDSVAWLVAQLMEAEVGALTGAEFGECAPDRRQAQRNGYRRPHRPHGRDRQDVRLPLAALHDPPSTGPSCAHQPAGAGQPGAQPPHRRCGDLPHDAALLRLAGMLLPGTER